MADGDNVTRLEFHEAIRRLDAADAELRAAATELERTLREDYESKIAAAVKDVGEKVVNATGTLKEDVGEIKEHLSWQDRLLVGGFVSFAVFVAAPLILHYFFHVG